MKTKLALITISLLVILCIPLALIRLGWAIISSNERAWNILLGFDHAGNAAINGDPKESISSRSYRGFIEGKPSWCILCKILDAIEKDHCKNSKDS